MKSKSPKTSKTKSLTVPLLEEENSSEDQPVPLQVCDPIRRSPRFTPIHNVGSRNPKYGNSEPKTGSRNCLRRSPRFSHVSNTRNVSGKNSRVRNVSCLSLSEQTSRRSPRLWNGSMAMVVSDRNVSVSGKSLGSLGGGSGRMDMVVYEGSESVKKKRGLADREEILFDERTGPQNGQLAMKSALVKVCLLIFCFFEFLACYCFCFDYCCEWVKS